MIIEFNVLCNNYKEKISNHYDLFHYSCPKCAAKARFHRHGTYTRYYAYLSNDESILFDVIEILRLKCQSCHSTHSVLPGDFIPFQIYSLPVVLFVNEQVHIAKNSLRHTEEKLQVSLATLCQKLRLLKAFLVSIEFYLRQAFLYRAADPLSPVQALTLFRLPTVKSESYFHCHGHPLFINRRNTPSYPLFFGAVVS